MYLIEAKDVADAWVKTIDACMTKGVKASGIIEIPNLVIEITKFKPNKGFDKAFRKVFGDERIDYASSYSFVDPRPTPDCKDLKKFVWKQNKENENGKWTATYWGRLINAQGKFNQIEQILKRLSKKENSKTIVASVYDPVADGKKTMGGLPCLTSIDFKPRPNGLEMTVVFRSMRFSKSGYGDFDAFIRMGNFLCEVAGIKFAKLTFIACSGHIASSGPEYENSKKLLSMAPGRK